MEKGDKFYLYNSTYAVKDLYNTIVFLSRDKKECEDKLKEFTEIINKELENDNNYDDEGNYYGYNNAYELITVVPSSSTSILCEIIY